MGERKSRQDGAPFAECRAAVKRQRIDCLRKRACGLVPYGTIPLDYLPFSANGVLGSENCEQLVALVKQYARVELTSGRKQPKRKMSATRRIAFAKRAAE